MFYLQDKYEQSQIHIISPPFYAKCAMFYIQCSERGFFHLISKESLWPSKFALKNSHQVDKSWKEGCFCVTALNYKQKVEALTHSLDHKVTVWLTQPTSRPLYQATGKKIATGLKGIQRSQYYFLAIQRTLQTAPTPTLFHLFFITEMICPPVSLHLGKKRLFSEL